MPIIWPGGASPKIHFAYYVMGYLVDANGKCEFEVSPRVCDGSSRYAVLSFISRLTIRCPLYYIFDGLNSFCIVMHVLYVYDFSVSVWVHPWLSDVRV